MSALKYVQTPTFYQAGSGSIVGATSLVLTSFTDIYGNVLTMANFGGAGYGTCEPDTNNEEAFTFTGVTANSNGTYSLTGVKTTLAKSPYTETSALIRQHAGGTKVVITDNVAFWNTFTGKHNDETVDGQWTFTNTPIIPGTVSNASTTVRGVTKLNIAPEDASNPVAVGANVLVAYAVDSVGTDAYAITPTFPILSYQAGQIFTFKAGTANTGAATLNVSGLGAVAIKKNVSSALETGDILLGQIVQVEYDGTNMQLISELSGTVTTANISTSLNSYIQTTNGVASKINNDASVVQNIAHGLGRIPRAVKFTMMFIVSGSYRISMLKGIYNGTTQNCIWVDAGQTQTVNQSVTGNSSSFGIALTDGATDPSTTGQTGVVTFDATNIIITWTKHGSPSGTTYSFLWEAQ